ncbi:hypothetical protein [Exiguobacterium sp. s191]|uniref:hypothetical protein n=1 Tax=Exiguobacterium sp. s191 TaxID=2751196 RepID=UPI002036BAFD|nr:hypothetical protein [Exiguobacterium sp. s191]
MKGYEIMKDVEQILEWSYWKAVIRYGHVGMRNEVSVARYLVMPGDATTIDVISLIEEMPGTKNRAMVSIRKIEHLAYLTGIRSEKEDFFLQSLFDGQKAL